MGSVPRTSFTHRLKILYTVMLLFAILPTVLFFVYFVGYGRNSALPQPDGIVYSPAFVAAGTTFVPAAACFQGFRHQASISRNHQSHKSRQFWGPGEAFLIFEVIAGQICSTGSVCERIFAC